MDGYNYCVTHCVCRLVLSTVQLVAVIKDVVICRVETGLDAVLHNLAGSGWRLQFLDLNNTVETESF